MMPTPHPIPSPRRPALIAGAVAFDTRSTLATVCVGMLVLWVLQAHTVA